MTHPVWGDLQRLSESIRWQARFRSERAPAAKINAAKAFAHPPTEMCRSRN
jgi:hypothetical protein